MESDFKMTCKNPTFAERVLNRRISEVCNKMYYLRNQYLNLDIKLGYLKSEREKARLIHKT